MKQEIKFVIKNENLFKKIIFKMFCFLLHRSVFFESEDFYTDVMELSEKEEGGIGVLTGKKVSFFDNFLWRTA